MQRFEPIEQVGFAAFVPFGPGVDDRAAAEGALGRFVAGDEAIAAQNQQRFFEGDLAIDRLFGLGLVLVAEQDDLAQALGGAHVNAQALMVLDALGRRRPHFEKGVEAIRSERQLLVANDLAALDGGALGAGEIHRDALAPAGALDRLAMHLQAAHAEQIVAGQAAHLLADFDLAAERRAGDDDAMALQDEGAVDRQAKVAGRRGVIGGFQRLGDQLLELFEALAGHR